MVLPMNKIDSIDPCHIYSLGSVDTSSSSKTAVKEDPVEITARPLALPSSSTLPLHEHNFLQNVGETYGGLNYEYYSGNSVDNSYLPRKDPLHDMQAHYVEESYHKYLAPQGALNIGWHSPSSTIPSTMWISTGHQQRDFNSLLQTRQDAPWGRKRKNSRKNLGDNKEKTR